jgi:hypothetical protein
MMMDPAIDLGLGEDGSTTESTGTSLDARAQEETAAPAYVIARRLVLTCAATVFDEYQGQLRNVELSAEDEANNELKRRMLHGKEQRMR